MNFCYFIEVVIITIFKYSKSYKGNETICKEKICLNDENWLNVENSNDNIESDIDSIETRSLPANITKEWHPTVPKPFSFTIR